MNIISKISILFLLPLLSFCSSNKEKQESLVIIKDFNIIVSSNLLDSIYKNYAEEIYIPVKFVKGTDTTIAKMRLRGDSSKKYGKKSLKLVFKKKNTPKGEARKINLNSEWTDKSYIRQYISSKLMQKAGVATYESNFVRLSINGEYWGLYLQVENMDDAFLKKNNLDPKGDMYKATKDGACLSHFDNIKIKWEKKTNKKTEWNNLQRLINELDTIPTKDYKEYLEKTFEYDKLLTIIAMNMLIQHGSTYYHNYYLFHDINGNKKWQMFPWDMDKSMNYYSWKPYKYHETSSNWESDNPLIEKAFLNENVFQDIKNKIKELEKSVFNNTIIDPIIEQCRVLLQTAVSNDNTDQVESVGKWEKFLDIEKEFVSKQADNILQQFKDFPRSFQLKKMEATQGSDVILQWQASKSDKRISYTVIYGKHFLLENEDTKTITNITDTFCSLKGLDKGKYYWRVYASDGKNTVEGYNTKSTFEVKPLAKTYLEKDTILLKNDSPHYIDNTWVIDKEVTLTIEPGCKLLLSQNGNILNNGNIIAKGTKADSIWFIPQKETWGEVYSFRKEGKLEFEYCVFKDGLFRSKNSNVNFSNCSYIIDKKSLIINGERNAVFWIHKGKITMNSCFLENKRISIGEGMNINYADAIVTNSVFLQMSDAIEYMDISKGEISNNIILKSPDDAIDMNGCSNIIVRNNIIINNKDKAISVGTEEYGPSNNITIDNNLLIGNKYGVSVKDSSFCNITNTSFINNKTAIEGLLKNNRKQYTLGGTAIASNCLFYNNTKFFKVDTKSSITANNSVSNKQGLKGSNNKVLELKFVDKQQSDYNTSLNKGAKISNELILKLNNL